mgnify:CR=1 FL=1
MESTTIKINPVTKSELDHFREYKNESYDEVIKKIVYIAKTCRTKPQLSQEVIKAIEAARARIRDGHFMTEEEVKKRLGL